MPVEKESDREALDSPVRILLVDDRPENLLVLEASLTANAELGPVELVRAQSGAEALRARQTSP